MRHLLSILFGAALTLAACWSTGKLLLARLRLDVYAEELQIFRFAAGAALFSLFTLAVTAAGMAYAPVFLALGAVAIVAGSRIREIRVPLPDFSHAWKFLFAVVFTGFGVFYLLNALAPEVSPDGSTYHLGLVSRYFREHGLGHITTSIYASLSQGIEMLFLSAFAFGRHSAAVLVEFAFFLMIPLTIIAYGRRIGHPKAAVAAALIVFCSPVFAIAGSSAYNDAAAVFVLFCVFYCMEIWDRTRQPELLVVVGLLAGFGYGIKYTLFLAVPYCVIYVAWKMYRAKKRFLRAVTVVACCSAVMILPWWIKNWVTVQNPVAPFANRIFSNPYVTPAWEHSYVSILSSEVPPAVRPIENAVRGGITGGLLGPLFLLTPFGLLAVRYREGRRLLVAGAIFLLPAVSNTETRFLMLAAPFFVLALCLAVMRVKGALLAFALAAPLLAIPAIEERYCTMGAWHLADFPIRDALRLTPERESLEKRLIGYATAEMINARVPPNARIFSLGTQAEAYLTPQVIVSFESAMGETLKDTLYCATMAEFAPSWRLTFRFPERTVRRLRIVQTAVGQPDEEWDVAEFRLFDRGREVGRKPEWRVRASANPWDVQLAFDNNPATRWRSHERIFPGMEMSVDTGKPETVDEVVLEAAHDQYAVRLKLEAEETPGQWITLANAPVASDQVVQGNLRAAAMSELKARGIGYLVFNSGDYQAGDFQRNDEAWGLRMIGQTGRDWLYAIK
jgi:hypothetical protein